MEHPESPTQSLTYRLKALNRIADRKSSELAREQLGLPYPEANVIAVIGTFGPQTLMDISRRANLDKGQASRTVEALLSREMVASGSNRQDGRSVIISLTASGKKVFRKVGPTMKIRDQDLYSCLDDSEVATLRYLLDKVLTASGWESV
ncbi:MarR family winged helix-turn-helix transcriptional regulator [Paraburkholderia dinghuensis]|nr:MarR family winged helix-turn-helix transcriptional regulator [Paraburkholderia dinghuensis]